MIEALGYGDRQFLRISRRIPGGNPSATGFCPELLPRPSLHWPPPEVWSLGGF